MHVLLQHQLKRLVEFFIRKNLLPSANLLIRKLLDIFSPAYLLIGNSREFPKPEIEMDVTPQLKKSGRRKKVKSKDEQQNQPVSSH